MDLQDEGGKQLELDGQPTTRAKDLLVNKAVYTLARIDIAEGGGKEIKPLVFEMPPNP